MELPTRIRATRKDGRTIIAMLIKNADVHVRTNSGPGYISRVRFDSDDKCIAEIFIGDQAATNPLVKFDIEDMAPGAKLYVSWQDNRGFSGSAQTTVH